MPDGRATAARITPRFGTATLTHFTGNVSVPAGTSVAVTIGGFSNPPGIVCVDLCQAGETNVPTVITTAAKCIFSMRTPLSVVVNYGWFETADPLMPVELLCHRVRRRDERGGELQGYSPPAHLTVSRN